MYPPTSSSWRHVILPSLAYFAFAPSINAQGADGSTDFESALQREASVAVEMRLSNFSDPVPLPVNITNVPGLEDTLPSNGEVLGNATLIKNVSLMSGEASIRQLAAQMPPIPQFGAEVDPQDVLAQINMGLDQNNGTQDLERRQSGLRVMIVGDSMTHCNEGDYTWRYRMWEWFVNQGIDMTFVGPYVGTARPPDSAPPSPPRLYGQAPSANTQANFEGGYGRNVVNGWPSNHFAVSGRAAAVDKGLIQGVLSDHPADIMLVMLGFNDLGWFYSDADGLIANMHTLIENARQSNPDLKIVIGTVPQRSYIQGRQDLVTNTDSYNKMLKDQVPSWSTSRSPVVWAPLREEYDCGPQYQGDCPAAYDGLHPNELGEYQIARAFSRGLVSGLAIGNAPLVVPQDVPSRPLPVPSGFNIGPSASGVTATWDKVYGAYDYEVDYLLNGGAAYNFSPGRVISNRWDTRWAADGWTYKVRIRATAGNNRKGEWTGWLSSEAHPETAPPPTDVVVLPFDAESISIKWTAPTGPYTDSILLYNVIYWDLDSACSYVSGAAFPSNAQDSNPVIIRGLVTGHQYLVAVETWNTAGEGFPIITRNVVPGRRTPAVPTGLQLRSVDATTQQLFWDPVDGAGGYLIWRRNFNQADSQLTAFDSGVDLPCVVTAYNFPGTWNFEWAVSAYNGAADGDRTAAVRAAPQGAPFDGGTCPTRVYCPLNSGGPPPAADPIDNDNPPPASGPNSDAAPGIEWTALGDSYASGVGTTDYQEGRRCLRYDESYPQQIINNPAYGTEPAFPPGPKRVNYVVCSGAEAEDIIKYQLLDKETSDYPSIQYGRRPAFGSPQFATLTAGGDDIDFPGILFNCIAGIRLFAGGPKHRSCTDQRAFTRSLLTGGQYIADLVKVIDAIMTKGQGQDGSRGTDFRLYVTGYGRFFNADTTGSDTNCDTITFQINSILGPGQGGSEPLLEKGSSDAILTQELRRDFNELADMLNAGVRQAVDNWNNAHPSDDPRVKFVDIQTGPDGSDLLAGHRFCEPHVPEPYTNNPDNYIWHYPYYDARQWADIDQDLDEKFMDAFADAYNQTFYASSEPVDQRYPKFGDFYEAVLDKVTPEFLKAQGVDDPDINSFWGDTIGLRARIFHPTFNWHELIRTAVITQYVLDHRSDTAKRGLPEMARAVQTTSYPGATINDVGTSLGGSARIWQA